MLELRNYQTEPQLNQNFNYMQFEREAE